MRDDLSATDWYSLLRNKNTEESWEIIKERLTNITKTFVPLRKRRPPNKPIWMTREILRAMGKKRRLWKKLGKECQVRTTSVPRRKCETLLEMPRETLRKN
jgi:hypothetical protein